MPRRNLELRSVVVAAVVASMGADHAIADETPKEIIAAHIRMQGFVCDKPVSAERDIRLSKPNETVWFLKCEGRSYQVRLVPDMAADVRLMD